MSSAVASAILISIILARHAPQVWRDFQNGRRRVAERRRSGIPFVPVVFMWASLAVLGVIGLLENAELTAARGAGWFLVGAGSLLGAVGLHQLGRNFAEEPVTFPDSTLVQSGVYALCRHPMRLGLLAETAGYALLSGRLRVAAVVWILLVVALVVRTKHEDRFLRSCYGADAETYQAAVPAFNIVYGVLRHLRRRGITSL